MALVQRLKNLASMAVFTAVMAPLLVAGAAAQDGRVAFTAQEQTWLAEHPVIRFAADPDYQPIESVDASGRLIGILADYLKLLEGKLGIRFEIVPVSSWDEAMRMARDRRVDMLSAATKTSARSDYMSFTTPHIELPGVIIVRNMAPDASGLDQFRGKKVGVVSSYVWQEWIARDHPAIDLQPVRDMPTGLLLVSFGQLDAMVGNLATATHFIQKLGVTNLRATAETGYFARLSIATRRDWPVFATILQKAVSSISAAENQAILGKWIKLEGASPSDTRTIVMGLAIIIAVVGLTAAAILTWNYSLRKMVRRQSQSLRESETRFRAIVEDQTELICRTLPDHQILTFVNEAYAQCFGRQPAGLIGTSFFDHVPELEREEIEARLATLGPDNPVISIEHSAVTTDGEARWHLWTNRAVFDAEGTITEIQAVGRDVTDLKRAEDALRFTQYTLDHAADAAHWVGEDGRFEYANLSAQRLLGYSWDELSSMHLWDVDHAVTEADWPRIWARMANSVPNNFEAVHRAKDGSEIPIDATTIYMNFRDREIVCSFVRDITKRKQAERAAAEAHARLDDAIERISEGFILYDADERLVLCNSKYREFNWYFQDILVPGARLEDVIRASATAEGAPLEIDDIDSWTRSRLEDHRCGTGSREILHTDGRWLLTSERRTREGGIVGIRTDITEHKRAAAALQDSDERLRDAIESITDGFVHYDAEQRLIQCNTKYREFYPWIEDVLVPGARLADIAQAAAERGQDAEPIADVEKWVEQRLEEFTTGRQMHEQHLRDGRWLLCSENRTSDGGMVGIRTDITERKRAEGALRESEESHRLLIEASPDGLLVADMDGFITFANQTAVDLHGAHAADQLIGMKMLALIHPDERKEVEARRRLTLRGTPAPLAERRRLRLDGSYFHSESRGVPFTWEGRAAVLIVAHDITNRKQAEAALRDSEERHRLLIEASPDALMVVDRDGNIAFANQTALDLHGARSTDQVIGSDFLALIHPDERADVLTRRQSILQGNVASMVERRRLRVDGSEFHSDARGVPFTWEGEPAMLIVTRDITERKRAEAALRESEEQLRQAQNMEVVGQLTGGVAHDFNNLLMIVSGNLELASEELEDGSEVSDLVDRASEAADRGANLTHRLLAFSRKQALMPGIVDLDELVTGMTDLLRRTLTEIIEVVTVGTDDLWRCEADSGQIESAILNLAVNARDAMPEGGKLTIETGNVNFTDEYAAGQAELEPGPYVMVAVSDTGAGMPRDVIDRVFEPFFTTKEVGSGSGLGLSMIYGFVKQSGGHVTIYSEEGHGTTVKLFLPRSYEKGDSADAAVLEMEPRARGETILVVEDEPEVRALAVALLSDLGYEVLDAANGESALAILDERPAIDLLFTDVVLPGGMSGPRLAEQVKRRRPEVEALFMSGYTDNAIIGQGPLDARVELLNKPFPKAVLARKVRAVLDKADT